MNVEMKPFRTEVLPNGLTLDFVDGSNRYFGDYWRVALEVRCRIPLCHALPPDDPDIDQARALLGETLLFTRSLEKMGVAGEEVTSVRTAMVEHFLSSAGAYMATPVFPGSFVRQQLAEKRRGRRPFLVSR